MGNRDDPRFEDFLRLLRELHEEQAQRQGEIEIMPLDRFLAEAEERYWDERGDAAQELHQLIEQARRRLERRRRKEGDQ